MYLCLSCAAFVPFFSFGKKTRRMKNEERKLETKSK